MAYTAYPNNIDGYNTLPLVRDLVSEIRAADINRLREAIIAIETELGTNPSGASGTVKDRLSEIGDANTKIESHLADSVDSHDASSISISDISDYYISQNVEGALEELAAVLPSRLNVIGVDAGTIPNSGLPSFCDGYKGTRFVFNTAAANIVSKTQTYSVVGIRILEVGEANGDGIGYLKYSSLSPISLQWRAPGDSSYGIAVDISQKSIGDVIILSSQNINKKIKVVRSSLASPGSLPAEDTFEVYSGKGYTGCFSSSDNQILDSNYITRTSYINGISRLQFVVSGIVYPADRGTLVLQRKRLNDSEFFPIAVLDLGTNFDEKLRLTGQIPYNPTLSGYDTITLYDRYPARGDYITIGLDSNGKPIYDNFSVNAPYGPQQLAKYLIPISNSFVVGGLLESPNDETDLSKVSAYRLVHYKTGITDFNGNPKQEDIFSLADPFGNENGFNSTMRVSNVYVDNTIERPNFSVGGAYLTQNFDNELYAKYISGIRYYNSPSDTFSIGITGNSVFAKTYLRKNILTIDTPVFDFDGNYNKIDLSDLLDPFDAYIAFNATTNRPDASDDASYFANLSINPSKMPFPKSNVFSVDGYYNVYFSDPFGPGEITRAFNNDGEGNSTRFLINSYNKISNESTEYFVDDGYRVGTNEEFDFFTDRAQFTSSYGTGNSGGVIDGWDPLGVLLPGELQIGARFSDPHNGGLIFPQDDYTGSIKPNQNNNIDYSTAGYNVDSIYQRLFNLGESVNSAQIRIVSGPQDSAKINFNDISYYNANRLIKIEVKIPGLTGWMDTGKLFSSGRYEDGDGALFGQIIGSSGDFTISFTFGPKDNAIANGMIAVRITYFDLPGEECKEKVIKMIQLLKIGE